MSRPRGFVLRRGIDRAAYPKESQGFATLVLGLASLYRRRARLRHAWPFDVPFLALTLGRLSVSRGLGYRGVGFAQSVATYQGWLR